MGSLLRSEEMTLCQLFLQSEAACDCLSELGELRLAQFRDGFSSVETKPEFGGSYGCGPDDHQTQLNHHSLLALLDSPVNLEGYLEKEIKKDGIPMMDTGNNPDAPVPREIVDLEATFEKLENEMNEVNANYEALKRNFLELTELKHNLRKTQTFFDEADHHHTQAIHYPTLTDDAVGLQGEKMQQAGRALKLGFVAGVILREKIPAFERMLWRVCRGNVFLRQAEIETPLEDPITGDQVRKSVCIIFFQGDQLKSKVKKICEGYRATLYPCPEIQSDRREMTIGVMTRIEDLNTVLGQTQDHRHRVLVAAAKNIKVWFIKVHKIKAIYHTLNMFNLDVTQKCLIAECWCPVTDLDRIQQALRRGNERSGSSVPSILNRMYTKEEPPTYNRTNKFTEVFQSLVDSYGVASYREINPAPYTIISFPFLFALMFGDSGHGAIVFLLVLYMVIRDKTLQARKIDNEIWDMFFDGRYIILLMGAFSIYTGLIYNDLFSKSINIFGSSWYPNHITYNGSVLERCTSIKVEPDAPFFKGPYPVGLDPVWQLSQNKITVTDSFKMKVSVIFGVTQMLFGVALSLPNHRHFKKRLNIFCEFIPQLIFMCSIFGYLIILIFVRWTYFTSKESYIAPNLLIGLINMFLMTYPEKNKNPSVHTFYPGQKGVQMFLVVLAVLCVPWMLLVKPCLLRHWSRYGQFRHQQLSVQSGDLLVNSDSEVLHHADNSLTEQEEEEPFEFGETLIHQGIHTIEYFLSCISHTASYLRLWALSLAHAQLSEVLWGMVMSNVLKVDGLLGAFLLVPAFSFWAFLTLVLLVLMEGLIAFLHALRLHWVEFQSKFYIGQGYKFLPFSFDNPVDYSLEEN